MKKLAYFFNLIAQGVGVIFRWLKQKLIGMCRVTLCDILTVIKGLLARVLAAIKKFVGAHKKLTIAVLAVAIVVGASFATFNLYIKKADWYTLDRTPISLVFRDIIVASYAHLKAGDKIPFDVVMEYDGGFSREPYIIDYVKSQPVCPYCSWGIQTNSIWLSEFVWYSLPFYEYERVAGDRESRAPVFMGFFPLQGVDSFHLLGSASSWSASVMLNERMLQKPEADLRTLYSTIIHEMVHVQGGAFTGARANVIEPKTQAATMEILAAMCNYGDDIACAAFWNEVESWSRGTLRVRLKILELEGLYEPLANLLWRDPKQKASADKSMRHWAEDPEYESYLWDIIYNYQKYPWEVHIIPGICGFPLDTEHRELYDMTPKGEPIYRHIMMWFDDTESMFPEWMANMICALPYGPQVP